MSTETLMLIRDNLIIHNLTGKEQLLYKVLKNTHKDHVISGCQTPYVHTHLDNIIV